MIVLSTAQYHGYFNQGQLSNWLADQSLARYLVTFERRVLMLQKGPICVCKADVISYFSCSVGSGPVGALIPAQRLRGALQRRSQV